MVRLFSTVLLTSPLLLCPCKVSEGPIDETGETPGPALFRVVCPFIDHAEEFFLRQSPGRQVVPDVQGVLKVAARKIGLAVVARFCGANIEVNCPVGPVMLRDVLHEGFFGKPGGGRKGSAEAKKVGPLIEGVEAKEATHGRAGDTGGGWPRQGAVLLIDEGHEGVGKEGKVLGAFASCRLKAPGSGNVEGD